MDNKFNKRKHTRKYLGVVLIINGFNYYIPLSSPKDYDYTPNGDIRKSDLFCSRIVLNDGNSKMHLYGKIMYKNMIPVPDQAIIPYDLDNESDLKYKSVVENELVWISLHKGEIINNSKRIYRYQLNPLNEKDPRKEKVVDFKLVEKQCLIYETNVK